MGLSEMQCGVGKGLQAWEMEEELCNLQWTRVHPRCWEAQAGLHHLHTQ